MACALAALLWLGGGSPQADDAGPLALLPDTSDRIVPFADQLKGGYSDRLMRFVATHYAGTQKMVRADNNRYRQINRRWVLLHYRLGISSGPVPYIHGDQWSSDWNLVTAHEDWFVHNASGSRHHDPVSNWDIHDIGNAAFRDYWAESVIADMRASGAQGVFADSFEAGVSGYGVTPPDSRFANTAPADPAAWDGSATWLQAKLDFVDFITNRFAATPEKFLFVPNLGGLTTTWWWPHYTRVDGAMLEGFVLNATPVDWELSMNRALELTRAGKFVIVQSYPATMQARLFLVASYLLIKGARTFINAGGAGVFYYPEYTLPTGPARDRLPDDVSAYAWNRMYKREFRDAVVVVNPTVETVSAILPQGLSLATPAGGGATGDRQVDRNGNYIGGSLNYRGVTELTLPAQSAALLARTR